MDEVTKMLERRVGPERAAKCIAASERGKRLLGPLFDKLNHEASNVSILEVGCSAGHITEFLTRQTSVVSVRAFEPDVEFHKVAAKRCPIDPIIQGVDRMPVTATADLPYRTAQFAIVIVCAVVEHLPLPDRHRYVGEYYRVVKPHGLVVFLDTPNRLFPFEGHTSKLPFTQYLPASLAFAYCRLFRRRFRKIEFSDFVRMGTGWRGASYLDLLPQDRMIQTRDVSAEYGYPAGFFGRVIHRLTGIPAHYFSPVLNVVIQKIWNLEEEEHEYAPFPSA